jgi:hypothetical protein
VRVYDVDVNVLLRAVLLLGIAVGVFGSSCMLGREVQVGWEPEGDELGGILVVVAAVAGWVGTEAGY